ncbi:MAG: response regulator transcription factor [Bacteroidales bacterium]|nr:response regulator transcription factor [Bacteroidales bacterium]
MNEEILVIEDEADLREILSFNLESEGYKVICASSAEEALPAVHSGTGLILLDVMLPEMNGFDFASLLRRKKGLKTPIIFLTALGTEDNLLKGFASGGDDYISKPFSFGELNARIKAVLRRASSRPEDTSNSEKIVCGPLEIYPLSGRLLAQGREVILSRKEFDILVLLARTPGQYFSRTAIIGELWQDSPYVLERTVDVHIARIRSKLGPLHKLICNRSGFGYYIDPGKYES